MADTKSDLAALTKRVDELERELAHHRDLREIEDVLWRYARAIDWLDDALLASVFFDDAEIDYGFWRGNGREFRPLLMQIERDVGKRWHLAAQVKIDLRGDAAEVESYQFSASGLAGGATKANALMQAFGYYLDRMEKRNGRWGIARRKHVLVTGTLLEEIAFEGMFAGLNQLGTPGPKHPDYRRLTEAPPLDAK